MTAQVAALCRKPQPARDIMAELGLEGEGPAMLPKDCKRLAEVDFPIAEVSGHAARGTSIRHGHPNTLHPWWARRPPVSSPVSLLRVDERRVAEDGPD